MDGFFGTSLMERREGPLIRARLLLGLLAKNSPGS
jgi:hypothetical protein